MGVTTERGRQYTDQRMASADHEQNRPCRDGYACRSTLRVKICARTAALDPLRLCSSVATTESGTGCDDTAPVLDLLLAKATSALFLVDNLDGRLVTGKLPLDTQRLQYPACQSAPRISDELQSL